MHARIHRLVLALPAFVLAACGGSTPAPEPLGTTAARESFQQVSGLAAAEAEALFDTTLFQAAVGVPVQHANLAVPAKIPPASWTEISHFGIAATFLSQAAIDQLFGAQVAEDYPEGEGEFGFTIDPDMPTAALEGTVFIAHFSTLGIIPAPMSADPTVIYQYSFVFDQDGINGNNYTTADLDFYNDSDRWYVANYDNANGWTLTVYDATGGIATAIASAARIIIKANAMVLVVPSSEFAVPNPEFRVSTFCHTGDFGIPPPHSWSGDVHPRVINGLADFPVQGP